MPPHSGPVVALLALLALAGIQKIADPKATQGALKVAGLPESRLIVLALGGVEIATGVSGIVVGGPIPAMVGVVFYTAFALFVGNALARKLPIRSCGCLGATETPPSTVHVVVNVVAAMTLALGVFTPVDLLAGISSLTTSESVAFAIFTIGVVYLLYGALTVLPLTSRRMPSVSPIGLSAHPHTGADE